MKYKISPNYYRDNSPSRERLDDLRHLVERQGRTIPANFDIDDIHWVTDRVGITDFEGCDEAVINDYFTINVAGELDSTAQIQADIDPGSGTVKKNLTKLAEEKNFASIFPPINLCSDNAAMIAWAGIERYKINLIDDLEFPSKARWPLDSSAPFLKGPGLKL